MKKKYRLYIIIAMCVIMCSYLLNKIAFFKDKEFERAVRNTKYKIEKNIHMMEKYT